MKTYFHQGLKFTSSSSIKWILWLIRRTMWLWGRDGSKKFLANVVKDVKTISVLRFNLRGFKSLFLKRSASGSSNLTRDYQWLSVAIEEAKKWKLRGIRAKPQKIIIVDARRVEDYADSLDFRPVEKPEVSVIIPVYNNEKLTIECLASIQKNTVGVSYEIILIDDGSSKKAEDVLAHVKNVIYRRNEENLGFGRSCNRGAQLARGRFLVFLNNDAQVMDDWLAPLVTPFLSDRKVGAVGPKILFPDGRLQEAGGRLNYDLSSQLIGFLDDPELPKYNFGRMVDYVSGSCLAVPKSLFDELEGFDLDFSPAYCEDVDLCFKIRNRGYHILYNPRSTVVHHLSATASGILEPTYKQELVIRGQQRLAEKWQAQVDELNRVRLVAFYLPQYHPIPENDEWWGKGFTEWRNVAKARPNFVGHYQPRLPSDLGFYDLRVEEVMGQQAELAKRYGVYGFCFYYYWFNGKRLLELPIERILTSNSPNIPFCLCWANENWSQRWDGGDGQVLLSQNHSEDDDCAVIRDVIRYFRHSNYIRINGKPLLLIYRVALFPDISRTSATWREICREEGIGEIYLAMVNSFELSYRPIDPSKVGFDAVVEFPPHYVLTPINAPGELLNKDYLGKIYDYQEAVMKHLDQESTDYVRFRSVMPSWDNTARRQNDSAILVNASPGAYRAWLESVIQRTREENFGDERIAFIAAWNEWGEGNYMEPDGRYGHAFLEATRDALERDLWTPK